MIIAVVIPCYKVEKHIADVIKNLPEYITYIITVNDCSPDGTDKILLDLQQQHRKIIYLKHEINKGVGGAMKTGFKKSVELNADIVIKIDGDGQMDASYIPQLLKPLQDHKADVAKGNRFRDFKGLATMPLSRRIGNLGLSFLIKAASGYWNIFDPNNGFVALKAETIKNLDFEKLHDRYFFESSLLIELYHWNAVVCDVSMKAKYGDEVSNLSKRRALFEFPPKLLYALLRRIALKYFIHDFNIASVYLLTGLPMFLFGLIFGIIKFVKYASADIPAPTGTVVIPTLLIILGFQLLLSALNYDINNYPKKQP